MHSAMTKAGWELWGSLSTLHLDIVLHFLAKGLKYGRQQCLISNPYRLASLILA